MWVPSGRLEDWKTGRLPQSYQYQKQHNLSQWSLPCITFTTPRQGPRGTHAWATILILDILILDILILYIETDNLLNENQYGFRKNKPISMALANLIGDLVMDLNNGRAPTAIFIDLKKAFRTLDHKCLISKLKAQHSSWWPLLSFSIYNDSVIRMFRIPNTF